MTNETEKALNDSNKQIILGIILALIMLGIFIYTTRDIIIYEQANLKVLSAECKILYGENYTIISSGCKGRFGDCFQCVPIK